MQPSSANPGDSARDESSTLSYGRFVLDLDGWSLTIDGKDVPLTFSEFLLLKQLARNPYRVLDRETLEKVLVSPGTPAVRGDHLTGRSLDLLISRVRRKLAAAGYDGIKTMRYVGYRFVPES